MIAVAASVRVETVGMVWMRAVRSSSVRAGTPRVIIVVVAAVPASIAYISVVVEDDGSASSASPSTAPANSPSTPAPRVPAAEASKTAADSYANTNADSKRKPRAYVGYRWRRVIGHYVRRSVNYRRIILRDVNYLRIGGLNHNSLWRRLRHLNLRRGFQSPRGLRLLPHHLHRGHHVGLLIVKRLPEGPRPRRIFRPVVQHIRKLYERFHAVIPGLLIHGRAQRASCERLILLHPVVRDRHLIGESRCRQNLCHQIVRVKRDRSDQSV